MDGAHSHSGGGGGAHSHGDSGTSSGAGPEVAGFGFVLGVAIGVFSGGTVFIGQHVYEAVHHVDVMAIHDDWLALFFTIGIALILGAGGSLLLLLAVINRSGGLVAAGCAAIILAGVCGLLLAPRFEARVIERSPTDPSKLRPAASIRRLVPKRVRLECVESCQRGRISNTSAVRFAVVGISNVYDRLCRDGYSEEWTSNYGPVVIQASGDRDHDCDERYSEISAIVPQRSGPWLIRWRLKDPTGKVALSSMYRVVIERSS
jgi:hypothetical protein